MLQVKITVTGGVYEGRTYEGDLVDAPVTILIPEGIESARTLVEAQSLRRTLAEILETKTAVTIGAVKWALTIRRMQPMINVHAYGARCEAPLLSIEYGSWPDRENAESTSRCLNGSNDFGAAEEWAEPITLDDGRKATAYYLFSSESIVDDDGNPLLAEDYPWDADHCSWIELDE